MRQVSASFLVLLLASAAFAEDSKWRTYAGGFSSRWHTDGPHGHDQPWCRDPLTIYFPTGGILFQTFECDSHDLERGNLDNSIGYRAGRERDFLSLRPLKIVGGYEGGASFTEYNLSQTDFALLSGSLVAGADLEFRGARIGVRYGGGPWLTTDRRLGIQMFEGYIASIPLRSGAALKISRRDMKLSHIFHRDGSHLASLGKGGVKATETAVMITGHGPGNDSRWEFATTNGMTNPGLGATQSLGLRSTAYHRLSMFRELSRPRTQAVITWTSSAHESKNQTVFRGFDGNFRSKTINSFGFGVRRNRPLFGTLSVYYGGGLEVADWRDDWQLLKRNSGTEVKGGVEGAINLNGAVRWHLGRGTAFEFSGERLYWTGIRLTEMRWGVGLVLTR